MYQPHRHHRRSIRLKGYDYAQPGLYFVTLLTHHRRHLLGKITHGKMSLSHAGRAADRCWHAIPEHHPHAVVHQHVVMPDHVHGIIEIVRSEHRDDEQRDGKQRDGEQRDVRAKDLSPLPSLRSPSRTIGSIVRGYKIGVTKWCRIHMVDLYPIGQPVWHRNYYEHIIRSAEDYHRITRYIIDNPKKWKCDRKGKH